MTVLTATNNDIVRRASFDAARIISGGTATIEITTEAVILTIDGVPYSPGDIDPRIALTSDYSEADAARLRNAGWLPIVYSIVHGPTCGLAKYGSCVCNDIVERDA